MTAPHNPPTPSRFRWLRRSLAAVGLLLLIALVSLIVYLRSNAFQLRLQAYIAAQISGVCDCRVEIGGFHLGYRPLAVEIDNLVLHGRESAAQPPLAIFPSIRGQIRIISLLHARWQLVGLAVDRPVFHIYRLADGQSNLPAALSPQAISSPSTGAASSGGSSFGFLAGRLQINGGEVYLQDHALPIGLSLGDLDLELSRAVAHGSPVYKGSLSYTHGVVTIEGINPPDHSTSLKFTLSSQGLRIDRLLVQASDTRLEVTANLPQLSNLAADGAYSLQADLPLWGRKLHYDFFSQGHLQSSGSFHAAVSGWKVAGALHATDIRLRGNSPLSAWTASGTFVADPAGLRLPELDFEGLKSRIQVAGAYANWRNLDLRANISGLRVPVLVPILQAQQTDPRWVSVVNSLDGAISGTVHLNSGPGLDHLRAGLDLNLAAVNTPGKLPLAGRLQAQFSSPLSQIALQQADFALPLTTIDATGSANARTANLALSLNATDINALRPLWSPFAAAFKLHPPAQLAGAAGLHVNVTGSLQAPQLDGTLHLSQFRYGDFSADDLALSGVANPSVLSLTAFNMRRGSQRLAVSGRIGLMQFQLVPSSLLAIQMTAANLDVAALQSLIGWRYPIAGNLNADLSVSGTRAQPRATGNFQLTAARWEDQPIDSLSAAITANGSSASLSNIDLVLRQTRITGTAEYGFAGRTYAVDVSAPDFQLSDLAVLQSKRLAVTGVLQFHLSGKGSIDNPQGTLSIAGSNLQGSGESLGALRIDAKLADRQAKFTGTDTLPNGSLNLTGTVGAVAPYPINAHLQLRDYDFDAWLRRLTDAQLTGHSHASGDLTVQGPLASPEDLTANATLNPIVIAAGGLSIQNQQPIQISANARQLTLKPAVFVAQNMEFHVQGSASLRPHIPLQADLSGTVNLALLQILQPNTHASGAVAIQARITGDAEAPNVNGTVTIAGGNIAEEGMATGFENIQGKILFEGSRMQIQQLTAQASGGSLSVTGYVVRTDAGYSVNVAANGKNIRARYQGISATGDLQVRLSGQRNNFLLAGSLQLNRINLGDDFDVAVFIAGVKTNDVSVGSNSLLSQCHLDIHLVTGPQVELATNISRLQLEADLHLRGTLATPALIGRASAGEGQVLFAGNDYSVDRAQVQFANPFRIDPILDLGLSTTVQQYDVTLHIAGPTDKLAITYRSDPPLSNTDIVALLATGAPTQASSTLNPQASSAFVGQSEQLLGQALDNLVAGRLQRLFGITQIQVNPYASNLATTGGGSTVTIQQQVSRNLKLTYTQNLSTSSEDIVQIDWTINRFFGIMLNRDQFGLYGLSLQFHHRAR